MRILRKITICLGLVLAGGFVLPIHGDAQRQPQITLVEEFLVDWSKDRYRQAVIKLAGDVVEVVVEGTVKVLRKDGSRFEVGWHPVRFRTVLPVVNGESRIAVKCVLASRWQFGKEIFGYKMFEFDVVGAERAMGIAKIYIKTRGFLDGECPAKS